MSHDWQGWLSTREFFGERGQGRAERRRRGQYGPLPKHGGRVVAELHICIFQLVVKPLNLSFGPALGVASLASIPTGAAKISGT